MTSKTALEVNLAETYTEVEIDPKYFPIKEALSKYYGLMEGLTTFLKELCHPHRNWGFIVKEARGYSLNYFHLLREHPQGCEAAKRFVDIFLAALHEGRNLEVRMDAADNLLLFLQKIIKEAKDQLPAFMPALNHAFGRIQALEPDLFFLFVRGFYRPERLARDLLAQSVDEGELAPIAALLRKYYYQTYNYWLEEQDPLLWFEHEARTAPGRLAELFAPISHERIQGARQTLEGLDPAAMGSRQYLQSLLELPGYNDIVNIYRDLPQQLLKAGEGSHQGKQWKFLFLFHIMNLSGLALIHEEALREINRTIRWLMGHESSIYIEKIIGKTFSILQKRMAEFPTTALDCVLNMGQGVYKIDDADLINLFIDSVMELGFQTPMIGGVGNDWQVRVNSAHLKNIRTWLALIELNPKWSTRLLSDLIINLSLSGVFIKDTDLFPRDITGLLNSRIRPVYNLVKQLARLFPVYFHDIGAEGRLRDISTEIDEVLHRKDPLVHFLRKQTHVESSNRTIGLMEAMFEFWRSREKKPLEPFLPPDIYERTDPEAEYVQGMHRIIRHLDANGISIPRDLSGLDESRLASILGEGSRVAEADKQRFELAVRLYKLLNQKYNLDFMEMEPYLEELRQAGFPKLDRLERVLAQKDGPEKLFSLLDYLEYLKTEIILSSKTYEIKENIYNKRHFTIDIPSMYGSYHEMKFDALGLTFRLETLANVLFDRLIADFDLDLITKATFDEIHDRLLLFQKALKIDGITSLELERQSDILAHSLEVRGFTFTQYLDIFKGFAAAVKNIISDYFQNIHKKHLDRVLSRVQPEALLPKYLPRAGIDDREKLKHRVSEIFFREQIALSLGLKQLDLFLGRILKTLFHQSHKLPQDRLRMLLNYDPQRAMMTISQPDSRATGIIHLGNKGFNLVKLKNFRFPIPPGFIITTEVFRCREVIESYPPAEQNFREQLWNHIHRIEGITGQRFGDPNRPLLFSVRSGASISQPGMMDTYLNVGINPAIVEGMAGSTGKSWFAWDNYRRFVQCYGMSYGMARDTFDALMRAHKRLYSVRFKREFTGEQMRELALTYKRTVEQKGIAIEEEPFEQLLTTIRQVLNSWESSKARAYRRIIGISDDWGTAVTVQSMVYGNISEQGGSGVVFTHNPRWYEDNIRLWGDFTLGNQGEDVVAGLVRTLPISISQQDEEMRDTDTTLESHFPEIYTALRDWAHDLIYKKGWSPQEIEFTFESPSAKDLHLLQTRDMAIRERKKVLTFDPDELEEERLLGNGIGVSGGAMSGRAVFTLEEIDGWRKTEPDTALILLRSDTVPDDIREIHASDGLLTARGGLTSHAAVVAHRLEKTCVVGCSSMVCNENEGVAGFNDSDRLIRSGDWLSIDGQEGSVFLGKMKVK